MATEHDLMATDNDIQRWLDTASRSLEILTRRLGDLDSSKPDAQGLNMLHLVYAGCGYAHGAAGRFNDARTAYSNAVHAKNRLYDLFDTHSDAQRAYDRSGNFQTVLMAHATGDNDLIESFVSRFSLSDVAKSAGPADSNYLATVLIALDSFDLESALTVLDDEPPATDPQFDGYVDCFASIARNDTAAFAASLESTSHKWRAFANRNLSGLPQSAFFLDGVALIHLARRNGMQPVPIPQDVPIGLLDG